MYVARLPGAEIRAVMIERGAREEEEEGRKKEGGESTPGPRRPRNTEFERHRPGQTFTLKAPQSIHHISTAMHLPSPAAARSSAGRVRASSHT